MPSRSDDKRIVQSRAHVLFVGQSPLLLIGFWVQTGMEQPSVQCTKMKLSDQNRLVHTLRQLKIGQRIPKEIKRQYITISCRNLQYPSIDCHITTAQIQLARSYLLHHLGYTFKILVYQTG